LLLLIELRRLSCRLLLLIELRRLSCRLLLLFLRVNLSLNGDNENLRVQREELFDGKLLDVGWSGEELVIGVLLLLKVQVRKLL